MIIYLLVLLIPTVLCKVAPDSVSLSGLSAGAFFAVQYQFAYSSSVKGVAVFAGGPYYCAEGVLTNALIRCMNGIGTIPLSTLEAYATRQASDGLIDPLSNLANHAVYLFSGTSDTTVVPKVVKALEQMYTDLGVTNIETNYNLVAAHTFPTLDFGNACTMSFSPYISKCSYDGAGVALQKIYGTLQPPVTPILTNILEFAQGRYTPNGISPASISMHTYGYAYIPLGCQSNPNSNTNSTNADCRIHVALHGCLQTIQNIGMDWVRNAGFNRWAESNNIIIVYPQAVPSIFLPSNPNGCFDWWGYTDANYANNRGPQMVTIHNMVNSFLVNY